MTKAKILLFSGFLCLLAPTIPVQASEGINDIPVVQVEVTTIPESAVAALDAYSQINALRAQYLLNPLVWDVNLFNDATVRATECSEEWSHTRPDGSAWYTVDPTNMYGENLARGYFTATDAINAWLNSPSHYKNICNPNFTKIAISVYVDEDGYWYWAQEFGY